MRYARVDRIDGGYLLDPSPYLARLGSLDLPEGAAAFAHDPAHYDFTALRCVKDLRVGGLALRGPSLEIDLTPNRFKHDAGLRLRYSGVTAFDVDGGSLGDLQLDELLPHEQGCSHEITLTGGTIFVVAADLRADWGP